MSKNSHQNRDLKVILGVACPVCGVAPGAGCREGTIPHDPKRGTADLRRTLPVPHRERRALWVEQKHLR